jgi:hypothetical protein
MISHDDVIAAGHKARFYFDEFDCADAAESVDVMLDRVIDRLRADPAIPRPRTLEQWTLFFADVRTAAEDDLTQKLEGFARARDVIEALADVLTLETVDVPA